ncbi:MAG TPA: ABC transporter permease [Pseudonocardiaceae bacterium]|jgi:ABC-2 type transport system permease protein|nr:ABC transporter permease [Pseudonocardiaceae bacterium]
MTTTVDAASGRIRTSALRKLITTEGKLFLRVPVVPFWGIGFPLIGLLVFGFIPGTNQADPQLGGFSVLETYLPIIITFTAVFTGINFLPATLALYRERGILRRLSTTPVAPSQLLTAQLILIASVQVVTMIVVEVVAAVAFSAHLPRQPIGFVVAFVLAVGAADAVGLLIAAVCWTGKAANAVGGLLFFVLMFFSGLWWPRAEMPGVLRHISDFTPMGSGVQALQDAAAGHWPAPLNLAVTAGYMVVCGLLASRLFRWE